MNHLHKRILLPALLAFAVLLVPTPRAQAQEAFPLRDGDTWVMAGDSITAQKLHTNYFEAFCFTRFPKWTFSFRNSGVGGDTIPRVLARFDHDVAAWKPTVVSVELGMNDSGAGPDSVDAYIKGMETLTGRIRAAGARPVFLTSSAVNDGTTSDRLGTSRNLTLHKYALALSEFAKREKAPFADQFHSLLDVWGKNKPIEDGFRLYDTVRGLAARPDFPGAENLRQWMDAWNKSDWPTRGASLSGDGVHPGPVGQLTMCVALLQDLRAPGLVSRATFTADGTVREQLQCRVSNVKVENGGLSFDRLDDCLPMPIPREARGALVVLPGIAEMSKWLLDVHGLRPGRYDVSIDGVKVGTATAQELQDGWNMGTLEAGPVADQCRQVLDAVAQKEGLVARWRGLSASAARGTPDKAAMDQVTQDLRTADGRIREAAQPKSHRFVVAPAK